MQLLKEFKEFLVEYKIVSLSVAFVTSLAVNDLALSLVNDIIMPLITPFVPLGGWEEATLSIGPVVLRWGSFLSSLIYFFLIMTVVFIFIKSYTKVRKKEKKN